MNESGLSAAASLVCDLDKRLMVVLRDGRKYIGILRSFDQFSNIVLSDAVERIVVDRQYGDIPLGLYLVRGENVVLMARTTPRARIRTAARAVLGVLPPRVARADTAAGAPPSDQPLPTAAAAGAALPRCCSPAPVPPLQPSTACARRPRGGRRERLRSRSGARWTTASAWRPTPSSARSAPSARARS